MPKAKKPSAAPKAAEEPVKVVPVEPVAEVKAPAKRKAAAAKAAPKAAPAKAAAATEEEIVIQFAGGEWSLADLKKKVVDEYVAEGHQRGRINKLSLYVKPEEHMAYYVINDKIAGGVDFD